MSYRVRMSSELQDLNLRRARLAVFMYGREYRALRLRERALLVLQGWVMTLYAWVLKARGA